MHRRTAQMLLLALLATTCAAFELSSDQAERAQKLYRKFIAPCCWRQSVAEHRSPEATAVRAEIDSSVLAGKSDEEIKTQMIKEYGHGILVSSEGWRRSVAYLGPILAVLAGLAIAMIWIRRNAPCFDEPRVAPD